MSTHTRINDNNTKQNGWIVMKKITLLLLVCAFALASGCGNAGGLQQEKAEPLQVGEDAPVDQTRADQAKRIVLSMEEVVETKGASFEEDIYIAVTVNQFDRLRLNHIRKTAFDKIKKRYPDAKVHVSTDKKIFMNLEELEQKLQRNEIDEKELDKRLKKIDKDMKG